MNRHQQRKLPSKMTIQANCTILSKLKFIQIKFLKRFIWLKSLFLLLNTITKYKTENNYLFNGEEREALFILCNESLEYLLSITIYSPIF